MNGQSFYERMGSMEMRHAYQLTYSMHMISEISGAYDDAVDDGDGLYANSMLDAFYVHIRLLGDFLVKGPDSRDLKPLDFGVQWEIPTTAAAQRLGQHWEIASKYVVHFGHPRVADDLSELEPFSIGSCWFTNMARNALTVLGPFIKAVEDQMSELKDDAHLSVFQMRATHLREAFNHACARVRIEPESALAGDVVAPEHRTLG